MLFIDCSCTAMYSFALFVVTLHLHLSAYVSVYFGILHLLSRTVEQFITYDFKLLEERDADGRNALHLACLKGHLNVVEVLSEHMSEEVLEACDNQMNRPLHAACESDSADIVKLLVEMKADTTARNHKELLLKNGAQTTTKNNEMEAPIHIAAKSGFTVIAEILLDNGVSLEIEGGHKYTPLHYAAKKNQTKMIKMLCDR